MSRTPELAVIVPAYNVEEYLEECIESILASTYRPLSVVIVDDGAEDRTPEIADELAACHAEVSVIHQENAGLSAARNAGIDATDTPLIAFVDSDDRIPPTAYEAMVASLMKSGSGMAVGAVERFDSARHWTPWFVAEAHAVDQQRVTGHSFPPILWNVFAWSKVFRRDYFLRVAGAFPIGMLYEDQEISAKMYLSGEPFDILSQVVYYWRSREDDTSITQNKTSMYDLQQRIEVAGLTAKVVDARGDEEIREYWYRKLLNEDLWWYYRVVPQADAQFWDFLAKSVRDFVAHAPATAVVGGPAKRRDLIELCVRDDRRRFVDRLNRP